MVHSLASQVLLITSLISLPCVRTALIVQTDDHNASLGEGKPIRTINTGQSPSPVGFKMAMSRDGTVLATSGDDGVKIWDTSTWEVKQNIKDVWALLAMSPDGKIVVAAELSKDRNSGSVEICSTTTGQRILTLKAHPTIHNHPYMHHSKAAFSPNGKVLATVGARDDAVKVWDTEDWTGETFGNVPYWTRSLCFSPDGSLLAAALIVFADRPGNKKGLKIWDAATGRELINLGDFKEPLRSISFSPDSTLIAGCSLDGTTKVWHVPTGELKSTLGKPNERHPRTGEIIITVPGESEPKVSLTFSPDGKLLAVGDSKGTVVIWDLASAQVRERFPYSSKRPPFNDVDSILFMPDGRTLLAGHSDGMIDIWEIKDH